MHWVVGDRALGDARHGRRGAACYRSKMPADDDEDDGADAADAADEDDTDGDSAVFPRPVSDLAELIMHPGFSAEVPFARMLDLEDAAVARDIAIRKIREGALDLCDRIAAIQIVRRAGVDAVAAELHEILNDDQLSPVARACAWCLTGPLDEPEIPESVFERTGLDGLRGLVAEYTSTRMSSRVAERVARGDHGVFAQVRARQRAIVVHRGGRRRGAARRAMPPAASRTRVAIGKNEPRGVSFRAAGRDRRNGSGGRALACSRRLPAVPSIFVARRDIEDALKCASSSACWPSRT